MKASLSGFGLIEVLIAMLVISISFPALFVLQKKVYNKYNESSRFAMAYSLANDELDQLSAIRSAARFNSIKSEEKEINVDGVRFFINRYQPQVLTLDSASYPSEGGSGSTSIVVMGKSVTVDVYYCDVSSELDVCQDSNRKKIATLSRIIAPLDSGYVL